MLRYLFTIWSFAFILDGSFGQTPEDSVQALQWFNQGEALIKVSQYDSAIVMFEQAGRLYQKLEDWQGFLQCRRRMGRLSTDLSRYDKAEEILKQALEVANQKLPPNHREKGEIYRNLAWNYRLLGQSHEALDYYKLCLPILTVSVPQEDPLVANTLVDIGSTYGSLGNYDSSFWYLQQGIVTLDNIGRSEKPEMGVALSELASYYYDTEQYDQALLYHQKVQDLYENKLDSERWKLHRAISHYNIARVYSFIGDLDNASWHYQAALNIDKTVHGENHRYVAEDYLYVGQCYNLKGNYEIALRYFQKSLSILMEVAGPESQPVTEAYNRIGTCQRERGRYKEAITFHQKALENTEAMAASVNRDREMASSLYELGLAYQAMKDYYRALEYFERALDLYKDKFGPEHTFIVDVYLSMGTAAQVNGDYADAMNYYTSASRIIEEKFDQEHHTKALYYKNMAELFGLQHDFEASLHYYQQAMELLAAETMESTIGKTVASLVPDPLSLEVLASKARTLQTQFKTDQNMLSLKQSMETYEQALALIDTMRTNLVKLGSDQNLTSDHIMIYEGALRSAFQLYEKTEHEEYMKKAFEVMEKSKSHLLLVSLKENEARSFAGIPDSILSQEYKHKINLALYEKKAWEVKQLGSEMDSLQYYNWQSRAFAEKATLDSLISFMADTYPAYHQLKYSYQVVSSEELQESLNSDQALLSYFLGEEHLYLLGLDQNKMVFVQQPEPRSLVGELADLRKIIAHPSGDLTNFSKVSYQLYHRLIAPVEELIAQKNLLIVPDGQLSYVPFELLINKSSEDQNYSFADLPYLIREHRLNYLNSATILRESLHPDDNKRQFGTEYLAFAPDFNLREDKTLLDDNLLTYNEVVRGSLAELQGTSREVEVLSSLLTGAFYQGIEASEYTFKHEASNYSLIHLATHAIVDDNQPMNSRLLFTVAGDSIEDGDLHAWELYSMKLNAQLAVLSACNTGFGQLQRGEGVMSLGRAFAYAGCPSILMSLWPAQDRATADIMTYFYQELANGLSKDEALQAAKLTYLEQASDLFNHPFYWAGFVSMGDPSPIEFKQGFGMWWLALATLMMLGVVIGWKRFK